VFGLFGLVFGLFGLMFGLVRVPFGFKLKIIPNKTERYPNTFTCQMSYNVRITY
jgi:hypothetical protein